MVIDFPRGVGKVVSQKVSRCVLVKGAIEAIEAMTPPLS